MVGLDTIELLYIIILTGSLAFGFEALMLGMGGKTMLLYRRRKSRMFALAFGVGLAVSVSAVLTSIVFALEPLYFCVLVFAYTFVAGRIVKMAGKNMVRRPPPPIPPSPSELEIVAMLRKRGHGASVVKDTVRRPRLPSHQTSELKVVEELRRAKRGGSKR